MEPVKTPLKINYAIHTKVKRVWEEKEKKWLRGFGDDALYEATSKGWFIAFEGSYEALFFGHDEPSFKPGDAIKITFEKVNE